MLDEFCRALFFRYCHQIPERCLAPAGAPLPVCARCTGLYLGAAVVGLWLVAHRLVRRQPWLPRPWRRLAWLPLALCLVDGLSGASHAWRLGNGTRFLIGYGAGAAAAVLVGWWLHRWFPEGRGPAFTDRGPRWLLAALVFTPGLPWLLSPDWTAAVLLTAAVAGLAAVQVLTLLAFVEAGLCLLNWAGARRLPQGGAP